MKKILIITATILLMGCGNKKTMENSTFKAEKVSRTATITIEEPIDSVFPLFGAFEERKWSQGWNPVLIYPDQEIIEEGTTFKTLGRDPREKEFLWRVSKFEKENYLIQYLVSTDNRYWTVTVQCKSAAQDRTAAEITYSYIGLNETGNQINKQALERMYAHDLKDWEQELSGLTQSRAVKVH